MPNKRITILRAIWGKLATQSNKKENAALKVLLIGAKKTENPRHDTILWDPPQDLLKAIHTQLVKEETFTRNNKKGGCGHLALQKTIQELGDMIQHPVETPSEKPTEAS